MPCGYETWICSCAARLHVLVAALVVVGCGDSPNVPTAVSPADGRVIFVTSQTVSGDFGGVASADALCASLATAARLPGSFRAWLSGGGLSPSAAFSRGPTPFVMTSGVRVADHWDDFADGTINNPIIVDERGVQPASVDQVWTGTDTGGVPAASGANCGDWQSLVGTGQVGAFDQIGPGWSAAGIRPCDQPARLYCVEQ